MPKTKLLLLSLATALTLAVPAFAGQTWDGGGGDDNWTTAGNWNPDGEPGYGTVVFAGAIRISPVLNANKAQNIIQWTGTSAWTFNNSNNAVLSLFDNGGGQAKLENNSTGLLTINAPITFAANNGSPPNPFGEINAVNGNMTFGSNATLNVTGSSVNGIKLFGSNRVLTFNNTVNAAGKYFAMTTSGTGNTVNIGGSFTAANFYVMNGGTLNLASGGTLNTTAIRLGGDFGTTGNQDLAKAGIFQLTNTSGGQTVAGTINSVTGNISNALVVNSLNTSGTNTITGNIFLDSNLAMTQSSGGTLDITNATLDLKAQTLSFRGSGGNINITGVIGNSTGSGQLVVGTNATANSGGTVTLSNANTYSGDTFVRSGTLAYTSTGSSNNSTIRLGSTSGSSVTANINFVGVAGGVNISSTINPVGTSGSGTLALNSLNTSGTNTYSGHFGLDRDLIVRQDVGGTLNITQARATPTDTLTGADIKGFTLTFSGTNAVAGSPTGRINVTGDIYSSTGVGNVQIGGTANANASGVIVTLSGNNTYSGTTTVRTNAVLNIGSATALGNSAGITFAGNGSFDNTTGSALTLNKGLTLSGGSPTYIGSNNLTLSGGVAISGGSRTVTVDANTLTLNGNITEDVAGRAFTKAGAGTMVLGGVNSFSGGLNITGGTLRVASDAALGAVPGTATANNVRIQGATLAFTENVSVNSNRGLGIGLTTGTTGSVATIDVAATKNVTYNGIIASAGNTGTNNLTKSGDGTLILGGASTYNGATNINDGTLIVNGSLASSAVNVNSGGTLLGDGTVGATNVAGTISPGNSTGTMNFTNTQTWAGGGNYLWEINNATGTAGSTTSGWDLISITSGNLDVAATSGSPFTIMITSLDGSQNSGQAQNFNNAQNYSWTIASVSSGSILNFDASKFILNPSDFQNDLGGGAFSLTQNGNDLNLNFTAAVPIPEPSTWLAAALLIGGVLVSKRRKFSDAWKMSAPQKD